MIKKITIENIQSHKESKLEFDSGINAIVGSSNNGKSAVLRALYWCVYNRPLGTDNLLSHWAVDKKGSQISPMIVSVENEKGTVTRKRTKTENQYIVNNQELNVVKTDVPEQVEKILSLSDTNIQKQQDAPFLLSLTSGQVAQYFNKIVRLDVIDRVLSNAESKRRKTNQEINQVEDLISDFKTRLDKYSWLDFVEKLLIKYDNLQSKLENIQNKMSVLDNQIASYNYYSRICKKYESIENSKKLLSKLNQLVDKYKKNKETIDDISESLDDFELCQNQIYPSFDEEKKLIAEISSIDMESIEVRKLELKKQLEMFEYASEVIESNKHEVEHLKKQLPDICPLCGSVMNNGKCSKEK